MSSVKSKRLKEVISFYLENGEKKTLDVFKISKETFGRYKREYKKRFGAEEFELKGTLLKIKEQFTDSELKILAKGGINTSSKRKLIKFGGRRLRFGFMTDLHLGSMYARPHWVLSALYEFKKQKCEFVAVSGDITEGMSNRAGHIYTLSHLGYDQQKSHAVEILKAWKGKYYMVDGNHDRWYIKGNGALIVKDICKALPDAEFLGHDEGNILIDGKYKIRLWHGEDSSSYATSYRVQKIIESFSGGDKPHLLICGHTHKSIFMPAYRNVLAVSGGAMCIQSRWMRSKRMENHSGFWIIDLYFDKGNVVKCYPMWYPLYIKEYDTINSML